MQPNQRAWVYMMANLNSKTLYVGVTNDLERRVGEHKSHLVDGFTERYNVDALVFCEEFQSIEDAIACEKKIKGWSRAKKIALVEAKNPNWKDLAKR